PALRGIAVSRLRAVSGSRSDVLGETSDGVIAVHVRNEFAVGIEQRRFFGSLDSRDRVDRDDLDLEFWHGSGEEVIFELRDRPVIADLHARGQVERRLVLAVHGKRDALNAVVAGEDLSRRAADGQASRAVLKTLDVDATTFGGELGVVGPWNEQGDHLRQVP